MNLLRSKGFSLTEIIVVIAIVALLLGIGMWILIDARKAKQLDVLTDAIVAKLEEAKSNSMSGKNGQNYGVAFSSTTYTYWYGTSYNSSDPNNVTVTISDDLVLNTTLTEYSVKFARITGVPDHTGTTTITSRHNASTTDSILIGSYGDITVIK